MIAAIMLLLTTTALFVGLYCGLKEAEGLRRSDSEQYRAERELLAEERKGFDSERRLVASATNAMVSIVAQRRPPCVER